MRELYCRSIFPRAWFAPAALLLLLAVIAQPAAAVDWLTAPSYYTHDSSTGQPVTQYAQIGPFYYPFRADYMRSGFRHYRSSIQVGSNADNLHIVEEWGNPIRPYEEWRFPFRPYSVPYDQWGPPFGGLGPVGWGGPWMGPWGGGGWGGGWGGGVPFNGMNTGMNMGLGPNGPNGPNAPNAPNGPFPNGPNQPGGGWGGGWGPGWGGGQRNFAQPWLDGYYAPYNQKGRSDYFRSYP